MPPKPVRFLFLALVLCLLAIVRAPQLPAQARSSDVVISQVYGGGNNAGASYQNDFVELFNRGATPVTMTNWSVQYTSASGTGLFSQNVIATFSATLEPGQYYLVAAAGGTTNGAPLPVADATGTVNMSGTAGKVILATTSAGVACNGSSTACTPAQTALIKDLVGFGAAANFSEIAPTGPDLNNTTSAARKVGGCTETDNNAADFDHITPPTPRNSASAFAPCGAPPGDAAPSVTATTSANGATGVANNASVSVTFSEPVTLNGSWFGLACSVSGAHTAAVTGGPTTYVIDPATDFVAGDSCTLTVVATQVSDVDANDPPDTMAANFQATFATAGGGSCSGSFTPTYQIQGSGLAPAITGPVTTKGVVIGDYEGPSPALQGFFIQDQTGDGNPATSDGIFVFNGVNNSVSLGDLVLITGTAGDFQDQTQISATSVQVCSTGNTVAPTDISLPMADPNFFERYEGMLVRLPQTLSVTEHFELGRFGEVLLSSDGHLKQPTNVVAPGAPALVMQAANDLNQIKIDDSSQAQDPDPIVFGRGGLTLSASNTLRGNDTVTGLVGVMTYTWAGNAASPNSYRVRPLNAMGGGSPNFQPTNPRPAAPAPSVGGTLRVTGMNLLNFFNTFGTGACRGGLTGAVMDCRGADSQAEFDRQWPKTVAAIQALNPDVLGINEIENDGYGPTSAIQFLLDKLNAPAPQGFGTGTWAFINVDANTGQVDAMGGDAIKVGMLYKVAKVTPVGTTGALNSLAFVNGGDSAPRQRAALAQAFKETATNGVFIAVVNHMKSKGSACDLPDQNDGQGNCNQVRVNGVHALLNWLATNPTGTSDPDVLLIGDYNSYAKEDPITALKAGGFTNLIDTFVGPDAYSYLFDGQFGYLDHALASPSLVPQVTGMLEYHINADEPSELDYNTDFKSPGQQASLYAPDRFRVSDHDPTLIGLALTGAAAPTVTITTGPNGPTNDNTPTFEFTTTNATSADCQIDVAAFAPCTSPYTPTALPEGSHTFTVQANGAGGQQTASRGFTVDTTPPVTTIDTHPDNPSGTSATFTFSADDAAGFECKLDAAVFAACTSPDSYTGPTALPGGSHTFTDRAHDTAGNVEGNPPSFTWMVDATPPETTITGNPPGTTAQGNATFTFTASEMPATFECSLDNATFDTCANGVTYNSLSNGGHLFAVRAIDAAGNTDSTPASFGWTVNDGHAPNTKIVDGPAKNSNQANPTFVFSGTDNGGAAFLHFECKLDAATFTPCDAAGPQPNTHQITYNALGEGNHTFQVRAKDAAPNTDNTPATRTWAVDLTKPVLTATFTKASGGTYVPGTWSDSQVVLKVVCVDGGVAPTGIARNHVPVSQSFNNGIFTAGPLGAAPNECVDRAGNTATPMGPFQVMADSRKPSCDLAPNRVNLVATGNMATVNFNLTAGDNASPAYALQHAALLPITGDNGTVPADIGPPSISPAGLVTAQLKAAVGSPGNTRTYTLTVHVTDEAGNFKDCTANVVVKNN